jgi:ElaB/YqjD/DUF883 family membrane-anchored ribosome-binding protein
MTNSEQLERETQSCREELAQTLDELRARMTPGEVVDQLVDYAQDTTGGLFFENLKQQVANNPLPVAVIGAGLAWLMFGKGVSASRLRRGTASVADRGRAWLSDSAEGVAATRRKAEDRLSEAGSRASDAAGSITTEARERMSDATAQVKDAASQVTDTTVRLKDAATAAGAALGDTVSDTYDRAAAGAGRAATTVASSASRITSSAAASGRDFMDFCRDQPLVLAGIGLAVGAAAGALLPRTQTEDELMGDVSDELKEQTKEFAGEQLRKAKEVGERAYDAAEREAERQGLSGEAVANEVTSRIKDTSSIAPSSEVDTCNDQTGDKKSDPVHERH